MFEKLSDADSCMTPVHCVTVLTYAHLSLGLRGEEHRVDFRSLTLSLCVCVCKTDPCRRFMAASISAVQPRRWRTFGSTPSLSNLQSENYYNLIFFFFRNVTQKMLEFCI